MVAASRSSIASPPPLSPASFPENVEPVMLTGSAVSVARMAPPQSSAVLFVNEELVIASVPSIWIAPPSSDE